MLGGIIILTLVYLIRLRIDIKNWNFGKCPKCGTLLYMSDFIPGGKRKYSCTTCTHECWVYTQVDIDLYEKKKREKENDMR